MSNLPGDKRNRRWTPEKVLDEIRTLSDRSAKMCQRHFPSLYGAAVRHFGAWKAAVEAAGIQYSEVTRRRSPGYWDREKLIQAIRELEEKHSSYVRRHHADLYNAALRTFGGWKEAIEAVGLDYEKVRRGWIKNKDGDYSRSGEDGSGGDDGGGGSV